MTNQVRAFARGALWALPVWAALLFLSTLTHQPDAQTDFASFAEYVTTTQFLISHLVGSILGAGIGSIGVIGLMLYLQDSQAVGRAITGMVATVVGNTLLASIFGLAAFAQTAMGRMFLAGQPNALDFYNQVYSGPFLSLRLYSSCCSSRVEYSPGAPSLPAGACHAGLGGSMPSRRLASC